MKVFIDNVAVLVIETCLIDNLTDIFSPDVVSGMSDDLLERLAAESENIRADRMLLKAKLEVLQLGLKTCSRYSVPDSAGTVLSQSFHLSIISRPIFPLAECHQCDRSLSSKISWPFCRTAPCSQLTFPPCSPTEVSECPYPAVR